MAGIRELAPVVDPFQARYHPRWFGRYVPDLDIEGAELEKEFTRSGAGSTTV
ncbi:hypothetical protein IU486_06825 [Streptomyces gardneri]|uniref:hypothetical protein n=1 Tax=Nocardia TaxID=1817 RepID=UPI00135A143D|nr:MULTISPECIES: hypothetical protein [Nocardia]MBF6164486.1 hypothetical protein [Streptomyces gardneri]